MVTTLGSRMKTTVQSLAMVMGRGHEVAGVAVSWLTPGHGQLSVSAASLGPDVRRCVYDVAGHEQFR